VKFFNGVFLGTSIKTGSFLPEADAQNAQDIFVLSCPVV
jgi:hypothetical protein